MSNRRTNDAEDKKAQGVENDAAGLVAAALAVSEGSADPETAELRKTMLKLANGMLQGQADKAEAERVRALARNKNSQLIAERNAQTRQREQVSCSHRKMDNIQPRVAGQFLSNGQLRTACLYCQKDWFNPPDPSLKQEACPPHLLPRGNDVGGAVTMVPAAKFEQLQRGAS